MVIASNVIFCLTCGSHRVDVEGWLDSDNAVLVCADCDATTTLSGFSLGKAQLNSKQFQQASNDAAIFRRNPEIVNRIRLKTQETLQEGVCDG